MRPFLFTTITTAALTLGLSLYTIAKAEEPHSTTQEGASLQSTTPLPTAVQTAIPYTATSAIEVEPLDEARATALTEYVLRSVEKQTRQALPSILCKPIISQPTPSPEQLKLALALVEGDMTTVLSFEGPPSSGEAAPPRASSYTVEFEQDAVTLRSSTPRYSSQTMGFKVAFDREIATTVWLEGKNDTSILFIVPPVRECSLQFVVACPRTYSDARALEPSNLTIAGVHYVVSAKADGLFKAPTTEPGRVRASVLGTSRVTLPAQWFLDNESNDTPTASFKVRKPLNVINSQQPFTPTTPPFSDAIEAHLEFGTTSSVARTVRARSTVDIFPVDITAAQLVPIERSEVMLNPGSCFVISRRKETHY